MGFPVARICEIGGAVSMSKVYQEGIVRAAHCHHTIWFYGSRHTVRCRHRQPYPLLLYGTVQIRLTAQDGRQFTAVDGVTVDNSRAF